MGKNTLKIFFENQLRTCNVNFGTILFACRALFTCVLYIQIKKIINLLYIYAMYNEKGCFNNINLLQVKIYFRDLNIRIIF